MKIWNGYGSEHSANLVIIGEFSDAATAQAASDLLEKVREVSSDDEAAGFLDVNRGTTRKFSDAMLELLKSENLISLGYGDPEELLYDYRARVDGDKLVIETDELMVSAFLKIMLAKGGRIQILSAHDHETPYGRNTR